MLLYYCPLAILSTNVLTVLNVQTVRFCSPPPRQVSPCPLLPSTLIHEPLPNPVDQVSSVKHTLSKSVHQLSPSYNDRPAFPSSSTITTTPFSLWLMRSFFWLDHPCLKFPSGAVMAVSRLNVTSSSASLPFHCEWAYQQHQQTVLKLLT